MSAFFTDTTMKRIFITVIMALALFQSAWADEGMWMIQSIDKALSKKMKERGLKLSPNEIYNADAPGSALSDAVVALDFACTGSIISDEGLLITNHHCAYADVHGISTPQKNYLEDGFWALKSEEERHIPGKNVFFLKRVIDVTDEVNALEEKTRREGKNFGMRKISYILEKEYKKAYPEFEAYLSSMWAGEKYYMALYTVYTDIRLVAAPPVSIAAFGGDIDNWEWPQHKCDFALYRVYAGADGKPAAYSEDNVPLKPLKKLKISTKGYRSGDFNMVIGFPGRTDRWSSSFKLAQQKDVTLPISNKVRGEQMAIAEKWMNADPEIRLKYSSWYFGLSNVQELNEGEVLCYNRFGVLSDKLAQERELSEWIASSPERAEKWGGLLPALEREYRDVEDVERNRTWFRETLVRGSRMSLIAARLKNSKNPLKSVEPLYREIDRQVEKELFAFSAEMFLRNVDKTYWSDFQKDIVSHFTEEDGSVDYSAMTDSIWNASSIAAGFDALCAAGHEGGLRHGKSAMKKGGKEGKGGKAAYMDDPLFRFLQDVKITVFNDRLNEIEGKQDINALGREYTHALYEMRVEKGEPVYPNANSTMRITYGTAGSLSPRDAVSCSWQSSTDGILQKYNPAVYDFTLKDDWKQMLENGDFGIWASKVKKTSGGAFPVDFINDCDITGGNSGSPVLNARGELIGLAFDGNKESLASDAAYTPLYNKTVCVDIRYVLMVLDRYAQMDRILKELEL